MDNKRKGINIQTWTRKGLSFLMALLLCVTTVFSVPTVSFAAEGEETAQTATEEQTSPSEGTSVVFKRDSKENENQESTTENGVEANKAEIESAENALKNAIATLQKKEDPQKAQALGDSKPQRTEIYYEVPVELMHAYEKKHSMGNPALVHMAKVFVTKDGLSYEVEFTGMAFMGMYGHLWNLYYRNEPCGAEEWTPAVVLEEKNDTDLENAMPVNSTS